MMESYRIPPFIQQFVAVDASAPSESTPSGGGPAFLDIVCPCYNPPADFIRHIVDTLDTLQRLYPGKRLHLIVANDGSDQNFGPEQRQALCQAIGDVEIVDIPHAGKGAAVRAGIALSKAPYTIYTDIDMPFSVDSIHRVIEHVCAGDDLVIAVRNKGYHVKLGPLRKFMSYGSKMVNRILVGSQHTDTQGGLKGLSPRARQIMLRTGIEGYLFDTEFVVLALRDKSFSIRDVEVSLREGVVMSEMSGKTLVREMKNCWRIFRIKQGWKKS